MSAAARRWHGNCPNVIGSIIISSLRGFHSCHLYPSAPHHEAVRPSGGPRHRVVRDLLSALKSSAEISGGDVSFGSWLCKNVLAEALTSGGDPGRGGRVR